MNYGIFQIGWWEKTLFPAQCGSQALILSDGFFFFFPGALLFPHMHALIRPLRIPESSLSETLFSLEYVLQTLATLVPPDSQFYLLKSGSCTEFHVCSSNLSQSETLLMQDTAQAIIGLT